MVFKCQENSFLKEFTSKVTSCEKAKLTKSFNGKKSTIEGYEVIMEDTILFPEGGGQPTDYGFLNEVQVLQVSRRGEEAVHFTESPLAVGDTVQQKVDWERRFDHMQQHSGQHLISAILEKDYGYNTLSWSLGEEVIYIELDTPTLSSKEIAEVEAKANELIRSALSVTVEVYKEGDIELAKGKTRGLPQDHKGDIRIIVIDGIDANMCCGTHVYNLSQLQVIKLLYAEKAKRQNMVLYLLVGNRVIKRLQQSLDRENKLTAILNGGPLQHVDLADKLQKNFKVTKKTLQVALKDIVAYEVDKLKSTNPKPKYYSLFRKDAEPDFMAMFLKEIGNTDIFLFLSVGDEKGSGNIVLYGKEEDIAKLGNPICEQLSGKGAGKGNRFQAKVMNMGNRSVCEKLLQEFFENK